jgi:hypothetical protein
MSFQLSMVGLIVDDMSAARHYSDMEDPDGNIVLLTAGRGRLTRPSSAP